MDLLQLKLPLDAKLTYPISKSPDVSYKEVDSAQQAESNEPFPPVISDRYPCSVSKVARKLTHDNAVKDAYEIEIKLHEKLRKRVQIFVYLILEI